MSDLPEDNDLAIDPANSRRLFSLGCVIVLSAVVCIWWSSPLTDPLQLLAGLSIVVLGCVPGLLWARNRNPWFPCFEISTFTCVVFYGIPLLTGHDELKAYPETVIQLSGFLVVAYLLAAIAAFNSVKVTAKAPRWAAIKLLPDNLHRYLPAGLLLNTAYLYLDRFTTLIPYEFLGSLRALFFGLGTITAFILSCDWGRGRLSPNIKILFGVCLLTQSIISFSHLYLISGMSLLILSAIGYTTTRRRLPWLVMALCLPVVAVLHNGKSQMRERYWNPVKQLPPVTELVDFYEQWFEFGLQKSDRADSPNLAAKLAERASLFQMLCMSASKVPEQQPYLGGESYVDIPAQVIPRLLWPDKPSSLMSNIRLAVYFNLIDPDTPFATSIAFGVLAEAYINFGVLGVLVLGVFTGLGFKHVVLRSVSVPLFSAIGIFVILLTAWSFQAEQTMATWLSSLFQACVICIGLPLVCKKLFGDT
ncbi:MAG: hypothetical protein ACAH89_04755 [Rariglobus sp.]|nr:hypothetical protein [Rariglobus sp.]